MGVWIEIRCDVAKKKDEDVTPCVGVWIEIDETILAVINLTVTPCVGVWIEMHCGYRLNIRG